MPFARRHVPLTCTHTSPLSPPHLSHWPASGLPPEDHRRPHGLCPRTACLQLFRTGFCPASPAPGLFRLAPVPLNTQLRFLLATPAHTCPSTFEPSFSPSFCSLFCTCQSLPALHSGNSIGSGSVSISIFNLKRLCVCTFSVWRERGRKGTLDGSTLGCAALCLCRNFKFGTPTPHVMPR